MRPRSRGQTAAAVPTELDNAVADPTENQGEGAQPGANKCDAAASGCLRRGSLADCEQQESSKRQRVLEHASVTSTDDPPAWRHVLENALPGAFPI